jgi:hypothetical protein
MKTPILSATRCFLMFTAAAAFCVAHPAKANLITNPGFETGDLTGWTPSGDASVVGTAFGIPPHSGNFQANLQGIGGARVPSVSEAGNVIDTHEQVEAASIHSTALS